MTPELSPRVKDFIDDPRDREEIELIIQIPKQGRENVLSEIMSYGATHIRDLPQNCVLVSAPRISVEKIAEIPEITRIEENADFEEFDSGK